MREWPFFAILKFFHFSDNTTARLKIGCRKLKQNQTTVVFKSLVKTNKNIVIDERVLRWK